MEVSASTVGDWARETDAPKPDKYRRYGAYPDLRFFLRKRDVAKGGAGTTGNPLKDRKLELEVEEMERVAALRRGDVVSLKEIADTISSLWANHSTFLHQKFEHELPPKYQGKNEVERRQLNVDALYEVATAFKATKVVPQVATVP